MENEKDKDWLDRKLLISKDLFGTLFGALVQDVRTAIIAVLILIVIFQQIHASSLQDKINSLHEKISDDKDVYYEKIVVEIKKRMEPEMRRNIEEKVTERTKEMKTDMDSTKSKFQELKEVIKSKL